MDKFLILLYKAASRVYNSLVRGDTNAARFEMEGLLQVMEVSMKRLNIPVPTNPKDLDWTVKKGLKGQE